MLLQQIVALKIISRVVLHGAIFNEMFKSLSLSLSLSLSVTGLVKLWCIVLLYFFSAPCKTTTLSWFGQDFSQHNNDFWHRHEKRVDNSLAKFAKVRGDLV